MEDGIEYAEVKGTKAEKMFEWVIRNADSTRGLDRVMCDGERLVATNGYYIVVNEQTYGLKPAMYDLERKGGKCAYVLNDSDISRFPRWRDCIPEGIEYGKAMTWDFTKPDNILMNQIFSSFYSQKAFVNIRLIMKLMKEKGYYDVRFARFSQANGGAWMMRDGKLTVYAGSFGNIEKYENGEWN